MVNYLLRMMSSWAIVCSVWYLPPMSREVRLNSRHLNKEKLCVSFFVVLFLYIESTLFKIHILVMDFFYLDLLHFILTSHPQNLTSRTCSHNNRICVSAVDPLYCFVALFTNSYNENNTKLLMVYIFKALYFFRQGQQNT